MYANGAAAEQDASVDHRMPYLLALAIAYTLLAVASVAALIVFRGEMPLSGMAGLNPFGPAEISRHYFLAAPVAIRVSGFLCSGSAIPLATYTAVAVARFEFMGARQSVMYIGVAGGLAASAGLAVAGLLLWMLSVPEVATSIPVSHALHFLVVLSGGIGFAVGQGLMAASLSVAGRSARLLPQWVAALGLLIAVTGALSAFGLLSAIMTIPIPVTRVAGFLWLIGAGAHVGGRHTAPEAE